MSQAFSSPAALLLLILLPLFFAYRWRTRRGFTILYSSVTRLRKAGAQYPRRRKAILLGLRTCALALLVLALAGPRMPRGDSRAEVFGVDIILTIDASGSMKARDFHIGGRRVNRLEAVQSVVKDFIQKRPDDRIGMVLFAQEAYTQSPLTLNHDILLNLVDSIRFGIAGDTTALGNALALAVKDLQPSTAKSKVVVLLSDGVANAGHVPPEKAAEIAVAEGVKVYTVGVYTGERVGIPFVDELGLPRIFYQKAELDEDRLRMIADVTGGKYFRATNWEELQSIYDEIDTLEKSEQEDVFYTEYRQLYPWFVLLAIGLVATEMVLAHTKLSKLP